MLSIGTYKKHFDIYYRERKLNNPYKLILQYSQFEKYIFDISLHILKWCFEDA